MAMYYNPKITTDGLVLALDAANLKSYVSAGTTWKDLSGQSNTATMIGTVPTSTDGGGCFDFATVTGTGAAPAGNASLGFSFGSNMVPTIGSFTLSAWIKNPPASSGQTTLLSNAGGGDGFRWGIGLNGVYVLVGPTYSEPTLSFNSSISSTLWYNVVTIFDRSGTNSGGTPQWQLYLNGEYQTATNMQSSQTTSPNTAPGIVRNPCCQLYTGKLAILSIYNRALSSKEILDNFIATRSRFGV